MKNTEIRKIRSYLYSIAGNIIKNYYKKKKEILTDQLPDTEENNLADSDGGENTERVLEAMSVMFSVMIIPEIWKNRRFSAVEIEKTAFYSLRQICSARTLLFGAVDLVMITIFFGVSVYTLQISAYRIIVDFLVPFN